MTTGRLPPDFSSLFRGIRYFWSSPVVTFWSSLVVTFRHISRIFSANCSEPVVTIAPLSPLRRVGSQEWSGARREKLSGFHVSSLVVTGRHLVVTGRHRSLLFGRHLSSPVVTFGRHAHIQNLLKSIKDRHRHCGPASQLRCSIAATIQHRR